MKIAFFILGFFTSIYTMAQGRWISYPFLRYTDVPGQNPHLTTDKIDMTVCTITSNDSILWIGGSGAYAYFKNDTFYNFKSSLVNTIISNDINTWIGTELYGIHPVYNDTSVYFDNGFQGTAVKSLMFDNDSNIWCGSERALNLYENGNWIFVNSDIPEIYEEAFLSIFQDSNGKIWTGTDKGHVAVFENDSWKTFSVGTRNTQILSIAESKRGEIWFGTTSGLFIFNGKWVNYNIFNSGLAENYITSLCFDKYNNLWIGHLNEGISLLSKERQWFNFSPRVLSSSVGAVYASEEGKIFIGSNSTMGGLSILEPIVISFNYSSCNRGNGGFICVNSSTLKPPLEYSIDNGNIFSSDSLFLNLSEGDYQIAVRNAYDTIYYGSMVSLFERLPELGNDTTIYVTDSILLDAGKNFEKYNWSTGDTTRMIWIDSTGIGVGTREVRIVVENNGCEYTDSIEIAFIPLVGISDLNFDELTVFPNPTINPVRIIYNSNNTIQYRIYDASGSLVGHGIIKSPGTEINLSEKSGIYTIQFLDSSGNVFRSEKIIKM
ncbi:MAG: two-component regulator propeller domain-containing protein [Bacteroidales bacterium]